MKLLAKRGRVLRAQFGCNPNSSSLGVDVTFLLFGTGAVFAAGLFLSALLRGRRKPVEVHGAEKGGA